MSAPSLPSAADRSDAASPNHAAQPPPANASRRTFLHASSIAAASAACLAVGYPVTRYLGGPNAPAFTTSGAIDVCADHELAPGAMRMVSVGGAPAIVLRTADGQLAALRAVCTHMGCMVHYRADTNRIACACHGALYEPLSGKPVSGPASLPLALLHAEVRDGRIIAAP